MPPTRSLKGSRRRRQGKTDEYTVAEEWPVLFAPPARIRTRPALRWLGFLFVAVLALTACRRGSGPGTGMVTMPGLLAYVQDGDLWVRQGGGATQLTTGGGVSYPRWSPDGKHLLFLRGYPGDGKELWLWQASGGEPQRLGPVDLLASGRPRWAADSQWVAFIRWNDDWRQPDEGVVMVSVRGDVQQVLLPGSGATDLAWHPDGWLAVALRARPLDANNPFTRSIEQQRQATIVRVTPGTGDGAPEVLARLGSPPRPGSLGIFIESAGGLRFDPTGSWLSFFAYPNSASIAADGVDLQAVPAAGGGPITLVTMLAYDDFLAWSPDGRSLAAVQGVGRDVRTDKELVVLSADSFRTEAVLTPEGYVDLTPAWSPDGRFIASSRGQAVAMPEGGDGPRYIWLTDLTTGEGRALLPGVEGAAVPGGTSPVAGAPVVQENPVWGERGAGLVFVQRPVGPEGEAQIWWTLPDGSEAQPIANIGPAEGFYGHMRWHDLFDWFAN